MNDTNNPIALGLPCNEIKNFIWEYDNINDDDVIFFSCDNFKKFGGLILIKYSAELSSLKGNNLIFFSCSCDNKLKNGDFDVMTFKNATVPDLLNILSTNWITMWELVARSKFGEFSGNEEEEDDEEEEEEEEVKEGLEKGEASEGLLLFWRTFL